MDILYQDYARWRGKTKGSSLWKKYSPLVMMGVKWRDLKRGQPCETTFWDYFDSLLLWKGDDGEEKDDDGGILYKKDILRFWWCETGWGDHLVFTQRKPPACGDVSWRGETMSCIYEDTLVRLQSGAICFDVSLKIWWRKDLVLCETCQENFHEMGFSKSLAF